MAKRATGLDHSKSAVRAREQKAMALYNAGGYNDEQIAEMVGWADAESARKARLRCMERTISPDVQEYRSRGLSRLEAMHQVIWPDVEHGDLKAIEVELKIAQREAQIVGYDHADGLYEREVKLAEDQAHLIAEVMRAILNELELTGEQRERAPGIVRGHLMALSA